MKSVTVEAILDKEYLYEIGEKLGLKDEALKYFCYFNSVPIDLIVDMDTGAVMAWFAASKLIGDQPVADTAMQVLCGTRSPREMKMDAEDILREMEKDGNMGNT